MATMQHNPKQMDKLPNMCVANCLLSMRTYRKQCTDKPCLQWANDKGTSLASLVDPNTHVCKQNRTSQNHNRRRRPLQLELIWCPQQCSDSSYHVLPITSCHHDTANTGVVTCTCSSNIALIRNKISRHVMFPSTRSRTQATATQQHTRCLWHHVSKQKETCNPPHQRHEFTWCSSTRKRTSFTGGDGSANCWQCSFPSSSLQDKPRKQIWANNLNEPHIQRTFAKDVVRQLSYLPRTIVSTWTFAVSSAMCTTLAHMTHCLQAVVLKSVFFVFARRPHMLHKQHDDTCIATGTSILMLEVVFSWLHRSKVVNFWDNRRRTTETLKMQQTQPSQMKNHKTTSLFIQYGTQRRWRNTRARPIHTHINVLTSWLHSSVHLGCCWPRHCQLSHHKSTSAHVFLLWISRSKCIASPWSTCPKGICSASRWDAGHASACSQAIRAQNNT